MTDRKGPSYLSPSGLSAWLQCQASWWHTYVEDHPREPATVEQVRGTFVHEVLERLAWMPKDLRTEKVARQTAGAVWREWTGFHANADFDALALDDEGLLRFADWTWRSIEKGLPVIADATVVATELNVNVDLGGVPFHGFIDFVTQATGGVVPEDWKTGKKPEAGKPWSRAKENAALLQPLLYAAALREMEHKVVGAVLVYIPADDRMGELSSDAADGDMDAAVDVLAESWSEIQEALEFETVPPASTSALCAWCRHLGICPEGQVEVKGRHARGKNVGTRAVEILGLT